MKKIAVISSCRSDISHLWWVMKGINESKKLDLVIVYPWTHQCMDEILTEFSHVFGIDIPEMSIDTCGLFYKGCLDALRFIKPHFCMVLGDRYEILAAASAATVLNIPIIHLEGGCITEGSFDNNIRNAISMLSEYHFAAHLDYAKKIALITDRSTYWDCIDNTAYSNSGCGFAVKSDTRIFNVGSPVLDWYNHPIPERKIESPYILACWNPVTRELNNTESQMHSLLKALEQTNKRIIFIMPNADPENKTIRDMAHAQEQAERYSDSLLGKPYNFHCVDNVPHKEFMSLMKYADCMVGNSSAGIIESASVGCPVVNVGNRQRGRMCNDNVFHCGYKTEDILTAIDSAMKYDRHMGNIYGDGRSAERIVKVIEEL